MALLMRPEPFSQEVNRLFNTLFDAGESAAQRFSRSLTLPEGVKPDAVSAEFDKGVLSVRIPKPEERKPRRVAIKPGAGNGQPAVEGTAEEK